MANCCKETPLPRREKGLGDLGSADPLTRDGTSSMEERAEVSGEEEEGGVTPFSRDNDAGFEDVTRGVLSTDDRGVASVEEEEDAVAELPTPSVLRSVWPSRGEDAVAEEDFGAKLAPLFGRAP